MQRVTGGLPQFVCLSVLCTLHPFYVLCSSGPVTPLTSLLCSYQAARHIFLPLSQYFTFFVCLLLSCFCVQVEAGRPGYPGLEFRQWLAGNGAMSLTTRNQPGPIVPEVCAMTFVHVLAEFRVSKHAFVRTLGKGGVHSHAACGPQAIDYKIDKKATQSKCLTAGLKR